MTEDEPKELFLVPEGRKYLGSMEYTEKQVSMDYISNKADLVKVANFKN